MRVRVLLIGGGGREHAIGWSLARSPQVTELISLPGNPGLAELGAVVEGVAATDVGAVAALARVHSVDLVVVGPEAPLAAGLVDAISRLGIPVFGPTRSAARLESSKAFAKDVMIRAGVPTSGAWVFEDRDSAAAHVNGHPGPYVVKADGLAAGKGVLVTEERAAALAWVDRCFEGGFGPAGNRVVIEEYLSGPEVSVFAVSDGTDAITLEPARDYKRLLDGDEGPNTGGMGSFSPVELPVGLVEQVRQEIILPVLRTMAADANPYVGFIYAGLVLTPEGPKVIEFNARLGDPETQVVLPRLQTDLVEVIQAALAGHITSLELDWSPRSAVNVVLAAGGYPDNPRSGDRIRGLPVTDDDVLVFHAGTTRDDAGRLVTSGGRVLSVVGMGDTIDDARSRAYAATEGIRFDGKQNRSDIG
ncbi:MAG: phosphoribosylamine--glycine ligase [Acidimicrobiia bacterium]